MESGKPRRRLIVNADDFGLSTAINQAVIQAHEQGILTTASLMVNGPAFGEAVDMARQHPGLGVGLHLTLACGASTLTEPEVPGLLSGQNHFGNHPVWSGLRYFFRRRLRAPLRAEIRAQLERFRATGLVLDHLNGHVNIHLHPTVLDLWLDLAGEYSVRQARLTRDPWWLNVQLAGGRWIYRLSHALIFALLTRWARRRFQRFSIRHTTGVLGLLQTNRVTEDFVVRLLRALPPGDFELYSHPSLDQAPAELEALTSSRVKRLVQSLSIGRIRYQDL